MRIVINLKYFRAGRIGGQEGVIRALTAGLDAQPLGRDQKLFALCAAEERGAVAGMCDWAGVEIVALEDGAREIGRILGRLQPDLYLCPMLFIEPADPPCPTVAWMPDLQHETFPEFFTAETLANRRRNYGAAARRADLILTPSEYARRTILERYPETEPERVLLSYAGVDPAFLEPQHLEGADENWGLPADYLIYPANFWPHKNHTLLLESLAGLRAEGLRPTLALTGDPGSGFGRVEEEITRLELDDQVRFLGRLPIEDFARLLRGARALVFPSLYEGFGLPILEAFYCDTPVLCSNVASCPEVAGGAALIVDSASSAALSAAVRRIWTDAELRAALVEKGRERREEFSREGAADRIHAALTLAAVAPRPSSGGLRTLATRLGLGSLTH